MNSKISGKLHQNRWFAIAIGALAIIGFQLYYSSGSEASTNETPEVKFTDTQPAKTVTLSQFDPNDLDTDDWKALGFTEKQAATILKYKEIVGGAYESKAQFKKCYAVSEDKYAELEPYILLPETASRNTNDQSYSRPSYTKKHLKIKGSFNPDNYTGDDWQALGFSPKQAAAFIKYRNYLGGSFRSKEKFRENFVLSDENYQQLEPYLLLPETAPEPERRHSASTTAKPLVKYEIFDPNVLDKSGWQKLGFSEKQAQVIVNYRDRNLKGSFKSLEDIEKCFVISEEKFAEMKPYIRLQPVENVSPIASKTDFTSLDLNKITFAQLTEFGFEERAAASFLGYRKKLGGFISKNQILETYNIDRNLTQQLLNTAKLTTPEIMKYTLATAPEEFLKTHPYFSRYAAKILFYRITYSTDKEILKMLKPKPEDLAKMELYLK